MFRVILATMWLMLEVHPLAREPAPPRRWSALAEQPSGPRSLFPNVRPAHTLGQDARGRWRI